MPEGSAPVSRWRGVLGLALAAAALVGYRQVGRAYYDGFALPQGYGMAFVPVEELAQIALFVPFGLVALAGLAAAAFHAGLAGRLAGLASRAAARPRAVVLLLAVVAGSASWSLGRFSLAGQVTSDDEHAYRFIAQTLRGGSLVAASPGSDLAFFEEQFVVVTPEARYGKYPIGHPLLLALGQSLGAEGVVVPVTTALAVLAAYGLGVLAFGRATALLGAALFATSPMALFTGATLLSQPASGLAMLLGAWALVAAGISPARRETLLAAAGLAVGAGVVIRPLPGLLFGAAALVSIGLRSERAAGVRAALAFGVPFALLAAIVPAVNWAQTGNPLSSGYQELHRPGHLDFLGSAVFGSGVAARAISLVGTLVRLDGWFLGWPLALGLCVLARPAAGRLALGLFLAATLAYRVLVPKVGVSTTGAIYMYEALPLLCLFAADGARRLAVSGWRGIRPGAAGVAALLVAGLGVSLGVFVPPKLRDLERAGAAQRLLPALVAAQGPGPKLVFHAGAVPAWTRLSWAYFPRCNSPALDDEVLYVRLQPWAEPEPNVEFWRRRYPGRAAFVFRWTEGAPPALLPLEEFVRRTRPSS